MIISDSDAKFLLECKFKPSAYGWVRSSVVDSIGNMNINITEDNFNKTIIIDVFVSKGTDNNREYSFLVKNLSISSGISIKSLFGLMTFKEVIDFMDESDSLCFGISKNATQSNCIN